MANKRIHTPKPSQNRYAKKARKIGLPNIF